eukprot:315032_1
MSSKSKVKARLKRQRQKQTVLKTKFDRFKHGLFVDEENKMGLVGDDKFPDCLHATSDAKPCRSEAPCTVQTPSIQKNYCQSKGRSVMKSIVCEVTKNSHGQYVADKTHEVYLCTKTNTIISDEIDAWVDEHKLGEITVCEINEDYYSTCRTECIPISNENARSACNSYGRRRFRDNSNGVATRGVFICAPSPPSPVEFEEIDQTIKDKQPGWNGAVSRGVYICGPKTALSSIQQLNENMKQCVHPAKYEHDYTARTLTLKKNEIRANLGKGCYIASTENCWTDYRRKVAAEGKEFESKKINKFKVCQAADPAIIMGAVRLIPPDCPDARPVDEENNEQEEKPVYWWDKRRRVFEEFNEQKDINHLMAEKDKIWTTRKQQGRRDIHDHLGCFVENYKQFVDHWQQYGPPSPTQSMISKYERDWDLRPAGGYGYNKGGTFEHLNHFSLSNGGRVFYVSHQHKLYIIQAGAEHDFTAVRSRDWKTFVTDHIDHSMSFSALLNPNNFIDNDNDYNYMNQDIFGIDYNGQDLSYVYPDIPSINMIEHEFILINAVLLGIMILLSISCCFIFGFIVGFGRFNIKMKKKIIKIIQNDNENNL